MMKDVIYKPVKRSVLLSRIHQGQSISLAKEMVGEENYLNLIKEGSIWELKGRVMKI